LTGPAFILATLQLASPADVQAVLDRFVTDQDVPGIAATVTREDRTLYSGGSGVADLEAGTPMTADTVLYAGSLTKILTAALVLRMVAAGDMALDQPVDGIRIPPAFVGDTVTVRHLLTHASGLEREGDFGYWFSGEFPDRESLVDYLARTTLRTAPGTAVRYSNIGYAALGLAIEEAAGAPFERVLERELTSPLGLDATGAPGPAAGIARGYTPRGRLIPNDARPFAGVGDAIGDRYLREYHDAGAMSPAFGAFTTTSDLARFAQSLLGHADDLWLDADLRRLLTKPGVDGRTFGLGDGRFMGRRVARHGGWFAAHRSYLLLDLDAAIAVVVIANSDSARPGIIAEALLTTVIETLPPAN
jgi:CubicO group peptidase (beta-lactamase class C family)